MTRPALVPLGVLVALAAPAPGCSRTSADRVATVNEPDAAPPATPSFPNGRSDILSSYVDASTLGALSAALARTGLSVCAQNFALGTPGGSSADQGRAEYLRACAELPPAAQRCLGLLYGSSHRAECQGVIDGLDAGTRAEVARLQTLRPTTE